MKRREISHYEAMKGHSINRWIAYYDEVDITDFIGFLINDMIDAFKVKTRPDICEVFDIVMNIKTQYHNLTLMEFAYFCQQSKFGKFLGEKKSITYSFKNIDFDHMIKNYIVARQVPFAKLRKEIEELEDKQRFQQQQREYEIYKLAHPEDINYQQEVILPTDTGRTSEARSLPALISSTPVEPPHRYTPEQIRERMGLTKEEFYRDPKKKGKKEKV